MRHSKTIWGVALVLFFAFSCTKGKGNIYVEGKVVNPVTGAVIPNIKIELIRSNAPFSSGDILSSVGAKSVKEVYSDANGNYKIEHLGSLFGDYYLLPTVSSSQYQTIGWSGQGDNKQVTYGAIKVGDEVNTNLELVTFGFKKYHFKNVNCISQNDTMKFRKYYYPSNFSTNFSTPRVGCYEWLAPNNADWSTPIGSYKYDWYVIRNGVRTDCTRVFTVYENDTTSVELFY